MLKNLLQVSEHDQNLYLNTLFDLIFAKCRNILYPSWDSNIKIWTCSKT